MGSIGQNQTGSGIIRIPGIDIDIEVEDDDDGQNNNSGRDYPIEIEVGGFRVIHDHDDDDNPIYYVYDKNNTLYGEAHSTSELQEMIKELKGE